MVGTKRDNFEILIKYLIHVKNKENVGGKIRLGNIIASFQKEENDGIFWKIIRIIEPHCTS